MNCAGIRAEDGTSWMFISKRYRTVYFVLRILQIEAHRIIPEMVDREDQEKWSGPEVTRLDECKLQCAISGTGKWFETARGFTRAFML